MSSALALASVTAVLKDLLENGLAASGVTTRIGGDTTVSALPPDQVASGPDERAQLNLFLYHLSPHTALRHRPGNGHGGLALELHYLLTAYGARDLQAEILLGHALQALQQNPVLDPARLRKILDAISHAKDRRVVPPPLAALAHSELPNQVEQLRIEPTFLAHDEMSKLWSALQAKYRPSATYRVSAISLNGGARP